MNRFGFIIGLSLFLLFLLLPPFDAFLSTARLALDGRNLSIDVSTLARSIQVTLALLLLMVVWWITEAIPLPATALLPIVILPLFRVVGTQGSSIYEFTSRNVLLSYSHPVIFLFLGGFLMAAAMQKWKLDRRFTLWLLTRGSLANDTRTVLLGLMAATAFVSMWISNTAAAAMMLPLGLGVISLTGGQPGESRYGTAVMLGIAWSASIGGVGTIIGTPPNGIALGILDTTFGADPSYQRITFLDWMKFGVPYVFVFVPVAWLLLVRMFPPEIIRLPGGKEKLENERSGLGPLSAGEKSTILVFSLAVLFWITNPFWENLLPLDMASQLSWIDEYSIGIMFGVLLFLTPVSLKEGIFTLNWKDTKLVDWGTLLLFGGGIGLSDAMFKTGLAGWIANSFVSSLGSPSTLLMLLAVVFLMDFLTEVTSNTAVTSMMIPVVISIAVQAGENPITLAVGAAMAASLGFMLPVATPPNALVYATGYIRLRDMIRSGFWLDIIGWCITIFVLLVIGHLLFGVIPL